MSITFVAAAVGNGGATNPASSTVNVPAGTINGDVMVAFFFTANGNGHPITPPAGWTVVDSESTGTGTSDSGGTVMVRVANAEPASYTFQTVTGSTSSSSAAILTYRGVDNANPVDAHSTNNGVSVPSVSVVMASVTAVTAACMLVAGFGTNAAGVATWTPSGTMTERTDNGQVRASMEGAEEQLVGAGVTGTRTATASLSGRWGALGVTLKQAAAPAGAGPSWGMIAS